MLGTGKWIAGGAIGLVGVLGLFLSANAHDTTFYYLGLGVFVAAVLVIGAMMKRHYDMQEGAQG
jgi:4-hydroxybenzoate polyprenyltransferase